MLWTDDAALGCIFSLKEQSSCYILPSTYFVSATAITAQHLKYPADCKDKVLEAVAKKNGCYSGLTLNQYGVASPCRTICTVCSFVALS